MGWMAEVQFLAGQEIFLYSIASRPALGPTQPPIQWVPVALPQEVKQPGGEADCSPPSSAKIKYSDAVPPLSLMSS
jgi:hypothetical protein